MATNRVAARNGILKIGHTINLALNEGQPFGPDLVIRASLERMTPVLVDAQAPGKEILHPVAVTIFGGQISATLLDAVLTLALLLRYGAAGLERLRASVAEAPLFIPAAPAASF